MMSVTFGIILALRRWIEVVAVGHFVYAKRAVFTETSRLCMAYGALKMPHWGAARTQPLFPPSAKLFFFLSHVFIHNATPLIPNLSG
jgi:hypothetical protein